jgi:hypothetical protein
MQQPFDFRKEVPELSLRRQVILHQQVLGGRQVIIFDLAEQTQRFLPVTVIKGFRYFLQRIRRLSHS